MRCPSLTSICQAPRTRFAQHTELTRPALIPPARPPAPRHVSAIESAIFTIVAPRVVHTTTLHTRTFGVLGIRLRVRERLGLFAIAPRRIRLRVAGRRLVLAPAAGRRLVALFALAPADGRRLAFFVLAPAAGRSLALFVIAPAAGRRLAAGRLVVLVLDPAGSGRLAGTQFGGGLLALVRLAGTRFGGGLLFGGGRLVLVRVARTRFSGSLLVRLGLLEAILVIDATMDGLQERAQCWYNLVIFYDNN